MTCLYNMTVKQIDNMKQDRKIYYVDRGRIYTWTPSHLKKYSRLKVDYMYTKMKRCFTTMKEAETRINIMPKEDTSIWINEYDTGKDYMTTCPVCNIHYLGTKQECKSWKCPICKGEK